MRWRVGISRAYTKKETSQMAAPKPMTITRQKVAAVYARFSSDEQKDSSIDDQLADCREIAKREGYLINEKLIFIDRATTGTTRHGRDGMAGLLDAVKVEKFDVLLCESQSRLARDVEDFAFLSKRLHAKDIILHTYHD